MAKGSRSMSVCMSGRRKGIPTFQRGRWPCKFLSEYSREESRSLLLCPEASRDSPHPRADRQENKGDTQTASSSGDHGLSERDTAGRGKSGHPARVRKGPWSPQVEETPKADAPALIGNLNNLYFSPGPPALPGSTPPSPPSPPPGMRG